MKNKSGDGTCDCSSSSSSAASSSCIGSSVITGNDVVIHCNEEINNASAIHVNKRTKRTRKTGKRNANSACQGEGDAHALVKPRSSIYRGVTKHRWTGRFEAHLWDKTSLNNINKKKGRQIYLGAYENEEDAARTHDLAAIKYWGTDATLNFRVEFYSKEMEEMSTLSKEEYLASLRRRSSGFSRGVSKYRGVARHHHNGRWEARIGRVSGNKYLYLGTYDTQEEAAAAYDMAAIEYRGPNAVTNFHISNYADKLKKIQPELETKETPTEVWIKEETSPTIGDQQKGKEIMIETGAIPNTESTMESGASQGMIMMDPIEEHDHPWNLCLDIGFNMVPTLPDIPIDGYSEVLGWLDGKGFEDNIECIFDDGLYCDGKPVGCDEMSGTGGRKMETGLLAVNGDGLSTSASSSSLSTMASYCSNIG